MTHEPPVLVAVEQRVRARPATVFAFFTTGESYVRWMGNAAELDARPGGIYRVRFDDGSVAEGRFVEVDPPRRVVFTWGFVASEDLPPGSSRVEVSLVEDGDGTLVRVEHHGLPSGMLERRHEEGWRDYLVRLTTLFTPDGGA